MRIKPKNNADKRQYKVLIFNIFFLYVKKISVKKIFLINKNVKIKFFLVNNKKEKIN